MKPITQPKPGKIKKFKEWLSANGALVLAADNAYEAVRFLSGNGVSLVCTNKHGFVTAMTGDAPVAWEAFCRNRAWNGAYKTKRSKNAARRQNMVMEIGKRDGMTCAYCGRILNLESATVEHVIPLARGGSDSIQNVVLACAECNNEAGNMNIRQKICFAVIKHLQQSGE